MQNEILIYIPCNYDNNTQLQIEFWKLGRRLQI